MLIVARSWRLRHVQPVWKDKVVPMILSKERFIKEDWSMADRATVGNVFGQAWVVMDQQSSRVMEIKEMGLATKRMLVRFQWPEDMGQELMQARAFGNVEIVPGGLHESRAG
jgi:hypothetical protein